MPLDLPSFLQAPLQSLCTGLDLWLVKATFAWALCVDLFGVLDAELFLFQILVLLVGVPEAGSNDPLVMILWPGCVCVDVRMWCAAASGM